MIYKIFNNSKKSYWLYEFDNKTQAVQYAKRAIRQYYYDSVDEAVHPSLQKYLREEINKLSFVKFLKKELEK